MPIRVAISHWLPIVTICPVNNLPDLLYVTITFEGSELNELYAVRKRIRKVASWKRAFMEDIAMELAMEFSNALEVKVELATGRHVVTVKL